jgi:hypothetical protein
MSANESDGAPAASEFIVDTCRQLLTVLGALLSSPAGVRAVAAAAESRTLSSISKAIRRLWFDTPLSAAWDSKEEAVWVCHLLAVSDGARAGVLSFYGAGIIVCSVLADFAHFALEENGLALEENWIAGIVDVERILRGRHFEQFQKWPADRRCGGGSTALLDPSRLPCQVRRTLDLDGKKLSKAQAAGIGVACLLPGSFTIGAGVIGASLLYKKVREKMNSDGTPRETDPWKQIQSQCMQSAHALLRRKQCPIEVRFVQGNHGLARVRVCLYSAKDPLCIILAGGINSDSSVLVETSQRCAMRPKSDANSFKLRVFKPGLVDTALNEGVEVRRGDKIAIVITASGEARFLADQRHPGNDCINSSTRLNSCPPKPLSQDDSLPPQDMAVCEESRLSFYGSVAAEASISESHACVVDSSCEVRIRSFNLDIGGYPDADRQGAPKPVDFDGPNAFCDNQDDDINLAEFRALAEKLASSNPQFARLSA